MLDTNAAIGSGGGEMGASIRAHDWTATPLGPPEGWPQPLRTLVAVMLGSRQPMFITCGFSAMVTLVMSP